MSFFVPKEIKWHVARWIAKNKSVLRNLKVVDAPAGSGRSTDLLIKAGASVKSFDLMPEFFKVQNQVCHKISIGDENFPLENNSQDLVLCQEGIEHIPDHNKVFREFNRICKLHGTVLITTPNGSSLRSRLSNLLNESEMYKYMPPNEWDSIWKKGSLDKEVYYGHVFLTGIQKLRLFAVMNGFQIKKIHSTHFSFTNLVLLILFYPWIVIFCSFAYLRSLRKSKGTEARKVYGELFKLQLNVKILLSSHLFVEFRKNCEANESTDLTRSVITSFNVET